MDRLPILSRRINDNISSLEEYADQYKTLTRKLSTSVLEKQDEKMFLKSIQELGHKFKNLSNSTKEKIFKLADLAKIASSKKEKEIIEWHINGHSKKLINISNQFREYTFTFKKNEENRTKFLYRAANVNASEEQIDSYVNSPGSGTKISSYFSLGDASKQIKIDEASRRQEEIKKINELAEEVTAITKMVSDLTFEQSLNVDNFGDNIIEIEDHLIKSNIELERTKRYKIRRRKFWRSVMCVLFFILFIIAVYYGCKYDWLGLRNRYYGDY